MEQITLEKLNEKVEKLSKEFEQIKEDIEFARRTEEAHQRIENGEGIKVSKDEFLKELKKW